MPYVNIKITREGNVTPAQKHALIEGATNLLHDVLGKNKADHCRSLSTKSTPTTGVSAAYPLPRSASSLNNCPFSNAAAALAAALFSAGSKKLPKISGVFIYSVNDGS